MSDIKTLIIGDKLQIDIDEQTQISTNVEVVNGNTVLVDDFMKDIWDKDWRSQPFDVNYIRHGRCFSFVGEIKGRVTIDNLPFTRIEKVSRVQEVQRRSSYRLPYVFDVQIRKIGTDDDYTVCQAHDLSERGVGLNTKIELQAGDDVECKFTIYGTEMHFYATVMRRLVWMNQDMYFNKLGIQFKNPDEKLVRTLRKFIFKQQIAQKR